MKIKADFTGWDNLNLNLKNAPRVRVGVLGQNATRTPEEQKETGLTNAEIGAIHEFGSPSRNIPRRSFLWDMIVLKKDELNNDALKAAKNVIAQKGGIDQIMSAIGIAAEKIVTKAFDSNGYGTWQPLSFERKKQKAQQGLSPNILMATTQLSKSITSEVTKKK